MPNLLKCFSFFCAVYRLNLRHLRQPCRQPIYRFEADGFSDHRIIIPYIAIIRCGHIQEITYL